LVLCVLRNMSGWAECPFAYSEIYFIFTPECFALCESVLALECCESLGVAGVKAASPV
jgi:hypothetical protein